MVKSNTQVMRFRWKSCVDTTDGSEKFSLSIKDVSCVYGHIHNDVTTFGFRSEEKCGIFRDKGQVYILFYKIVTIYTQSLNSQKRHFRRLLPLDSNHMEPVDNLRSPVA